MIAASLRVGIAAALVVPAAACGHKGPPQAPLRPVPVAILDAAIERDGSAVRVRFTVPDANTDGSAPPAVDRVEVFALSRAAADPAPAPADLTAPAHLVATVGVRSPAPEKPGAPPDPRPAAGEAAAVVDAVTGADAGDAALVRYYALVPAAGRRRGRVSPVLRVPLSASPAAPAGVRIDYSERTLTIEWQPSAAGQRFVVLETDERGAGAAAVSARPIEAPTFDLPVEFGRARCFAVRAVEVTGAVSVAGRPSAPVCVTPRDRFAPPVPAGLVAVAVEGAVELSWNAVTAADLAGYLVLRGDGPNGTLQRLTPAPVADVSYRDASVRAGATYVYAVAAVDTAAPPNESAASERQVVTARGPAPGGRRER